VFSLSLSLFPLKRLSRFEEVLGVFISCAYLFCLCGKKKLFKVVVVFLHFQGSPINANANTFG
jgi:hypothetical protein